jgi:hypothetical protein
MKRRGLLACGCVCLAAFVFTIANPNTCQAARQFEVETNYYTCPPDAESLAECEWNGMLFAPCEGTIIIEGSLTGNYKTTFAEGCSTSQYSITCYEWCLVDWCWTECF